MTPEKVVEVQKYGRAPISLDLLVPAEPDEYGIAERTERGWVVPLAWRIVDVDEITPEQVVSFTLLQEQLHQVLDTLSEREAGVVSMRFGLSDGQTKTLDEIGKVYGVTRERIRQIEKKTMDKLRQPSRYAVLRDYLDASHPRDEESGAAYLKEVPESSGGSAETLFKVREAVETGMVLSDH